MSATTSVEQWCALLNLALCADGSPCDFDALCNACGRSVAYGLLKSVWPMTFRRGLALLGGQMAEHDRLGADPLVKSCSTDDESVAREYRALRFQSVCADLKHSLIFPLSETSEGRRRILVIDDNPQKLDLDLLAKTKDAFLPNWEIEVWNPTRGDDAKAVLKGLCSYGTLRDHGSTDIGREIRTGLLGGSELTWTGQGKTLSQVLSGTRFILVDLLFKGVDCGDTGEGDFQGVALIRGLARWMRDNLGGALPDVLALSRTDDPGIIQAAMRSGARDYVLKSRLLRLPGVLACLHPPQDESADALHRNFRQLYSLPNGTIGLLRNVCIPADRDKSRPPGPAAAEAAPSRAGSGPDAMGELLGAIPKTDLHVHAGTCMDPAFLVMASLVMLARHVGEAEFRKEVAAVASFLKRLRDGRPQRVCIPLESEHDLWVQVPKPARGAHAGSDFGRVADAFRRAVLCELRGHPSGAGGREKQRALRAFLHRVLEIRDHIDIREVRNGLARLGDTALAVSALGRAAYGAGRRTRTLRCLGADADDLMRIWILTTATESELTWRGRAATKVSGLLKSRGNGLLWKKLHDRLWASKEGLSPDALRRNGWRLPKQAPGLLPILKLDGGARTALSTALSTGTRGKNLAEYLDGCDICGAAHLKHPVLIHLYAQHLLPQFVAKGVMYAEVRASLYGYTNEKAKFGFADVCLCAMTAFRDAHAVVGKRLTRAQARNAAVPAWVASVLGREGPQLQNILSVEDKSTARYPQFPVKVNLVLVGKRHKALRQMIMEAAGVVAMHGAPAARPKSARDFAADEFGECRIVGFDLAGAEPDYPPAQFIAEFAPLRKLHIPLTVHAGENAGPQFIEDAILELGAERIGHGLALVEDRALMGRVREHRICIELCPVSNHQTSQFSAPSRASPKPHRPYPMKDLLDAGVPVCLNTDNPFVSDTDMVKEFFQASYAYGGNGLSLWEALRIIRTGFIHAFMTLPERRAMLELADQIIFDLFSRPDVVELLREMAAVRTAAEGTKP